MCACSIYECVLYIWVCAVHMGVCCTYVHMGVCCMCVVHVCVGGRIFVGETFTEFGFFICRCMLCFAIAQELSLNTVEPA